MNTEQLQIGYFFYDKKNGYFSVDLCEMWIKTKCKRGSAGDTELVTKEEGELLRTRSQWLLSHIMIPQWEGWRVSTTPHTLLCVF